MTRRIVGIFVVLLAVVGGGVIARAQSLLGERDVVVAEVLRTQDRLDAAQERSQSLEQKTDAAQQHLAELTMVAEVRPAFVSEISAFAAALKAAEGKVDTAPTRAAAVATQQKVLEERVDPAVVTAATASVRALTDKVKSEIAAWEAAQRVTAGPSGPRWSRSGPEGYARVRAALDRVGGSGVGLFESSSCAGGTAPACANSGGYIKYRADIANWSSSRLNWAMAHELAHIHQFRVWGALKASAQYQSLFGGNPESLANCMAAVRGYPGSGSCNAQQRSWASGIWVGRVS